MKSYRLILASCFIVFNFVSTFSQSAQEDPSRAQPQPNTLSVNKILAPSKTSDESNREIETLWLKLKELENQNRILTEALTDLKTKVDLLGHREALSSNAESAKPDQSIPMTSAPPSGQVDKDPPVRWSELLGEGNKLKFYGFLRLDLDLDSQRPNNAQAPLFITSPDLSAGGTTKGDFSMHPRLTRFGMDYSGPRIGALGDAKLSGKLETDFENGGSESRQIIRIRHAYLRLDWKETSILAGQTWDIVSPLFPTVNNDTLMWNAGNVGDRRPQFRLAYEPRAGRGKISLVGGIGLTGAIDAKDLDNNGFRDGEESSRPNLQGRIGYSYAIGKDRNASFGVSGFYGFENTSRLIAGRNAFRSQLLNVDFTVPLASRLSFRGEGWWGRNMSDVRGGAGQGINVATGREIRGRGGWVEANVKLSRYLSVNPGFTTDDPVDADLSPGGRTRNRAFYFANRITPGGNFLIGVDYLRWLTEYKGLFRGLNNRLNAFIQYNF